MAWSVFWNAVTHTTLWTVLFVQMPFYIQNTETDLVLDVKAGGEGGESQVIMFTYHGGPNQLWEYKNGMIHSKLNGWVQHTSCHRGKLRC
jgi:hypothetical protein